MRALSIHTRSLRLAGKEVLLTQVISDTGAIGCGLSFRRDATESRHMAERRAGLRADASLIASGFSPPRPPGSSGATR